MAEVSGKEYQDAYFRVAKKYKQAFLNYLNEMKGIAEKEKISLALKEAFDTASGPADLENKLNEVISKIAPQYKAVAKRLMDQIKHELSYEYAKIWDDNSRAKMRSAAQTANIGKYYKMYWAEDFEGLRRELNLTDEEVEELKSMPPKKALKKIASKTTVREEYEKTIKKAPFKKKLIVELNK